LGRLAAEIAAVKPIHLEFSKLRKTRPAEYATRFLFGCAVTAAATLLGKWAGPVIGGLFLAFPGIFPPGISFVEKEELQEKQRAGVHGTQRARMLASVEAAGASAGTFGLLTFAVIVWFGLARMGPVPTLLLATAAWFAVAFAAWWIRERI
jgi:hypothetical protein